MYNQQQTKQYLARIGLTDSLPHSADTLSRIVRAHYFTVPYENLDVLADIPISLDRQDLFDKIVVRNRGGYCFELNAALGDLLIGMGHQLVRLTGRFIMGEPEGITPMRRHHILLVTLPEGQYLVDAGIMRESCRPHSRWAWNSLTAWPAMCCARMIFTATSWIRPFPARTMLHCLVLP